MKLLFAQGNPDTQFIGSRHNTGFMIIDAFASSHQLQWTEKKKFHASIAETDYGGEKVFLVKPTTFYNDTGLSVGKLIDFYQLDPSKDLLVIHDDLALPFGTIRTRVRGSDAGNNGIKSINSHIGSDYHRIRIGIWNDLRERMDDADFVLAKFNEAEYDTLRSEITPKALKLMEEFIIDTLETSSYIL